MSTCWTCGAVHDPDGPCKRVPRVRPADDLFDDAPEPRGYGPVFVAQYETEDACCGAGIEPGDRIRADGGGGWIHATEECEK